MISVSYRAYDSLSNVQVGTIAAADEQAAVDALYELGLTPYETKIVGRSERDARSRRRLTANLDKRQSLRTDTDRVGLNELTAFTTEFASLATSGVALDDALRIISGSDSSRSIARLSAGILDEMLSGSQLSESLERRSAIFAADYRAIVRAGETAGSMGQALSQIADLLSRRLEIRRKIAAALIYPMILLGMSILSIGMIVAFLLPSLAPIFTDANRPLPPILATLMELQDNWMMLLVVAGTAMVAILVAVQVGKRNRTALQALDRIKVAIPLAGQLIRMRDASRFTRALGTLLTAGVPLLPSLKTARDLVSNRSLAAQYDAAIARVPEGLAVHACFESSGLIPSSALRLVTIGEETGKLGSMLLRAAGLIENDHLRRIERMLGLLTPLLTLVIGGAVASLIVTVMSAVLSINDLAFQ